jgi:hypothetical protein
MPKQTSVQKAPIIDLTSIVGIESQFREGPNDPSGAELAGYFADIYIWSEQIRYILPIPTAREAHVPCLVRKLASLNKRVLIPEQYSASEIPRLNSENVEENFLNFAVWIGQNRDWFVRWSNLHYESWIRDHHYAWIGRDYFYDMEALKRSSILKQAAMKLDIPTYKLLYAFDILLRYPYYGKLAGEDNFYLAHPIRTEPCLNGILNEPVSSPPIPFSFKDTVKKWATHMKLQDYILLLHAARNYVRDKKYHKLDTSEVTTDILREVACNLDLPPRLKRIPLPKQLGTLAETFVPDKFRSLLTTVKAFWDKPPRSFSKIRWLRPLLTSDLEIQARRNPVPHPQSPPNKRSFHIFEYLFDIPVTEA